MMREIDAGLQKKYSIEGDIRRSIRYIQHFL